MESQIVIAAMLGTLVVLLAMGQYLFAAVGVAGAVALILMGNMQATTGRILWSTTTSWDLTSMTLFVFMGEVISRGGIAGPLYHFTGYWLARLPGRLLHSNVVAAALFSCISGSTVACTATIGAVAIPEQTKLGYNRRLVIGSVAASGLLGILIPPSINMIIYATWVEMSIAKLFMGGVLPGILLATMFITYIVLTCWRNPSLTPGRVARLSSGELLQTFKEGALPVLILFAIIWGGIFSGMMTATEAASVSAVAACVMAAVGRKLSWKMLRDSLLATLRITCMIMAIMFGAKLIAVAVAVLGVTEWVVNLIVGSKLSALPVLFILFGIYIVLGCFIDGISMMMLTLPFVIPILQHVGVDTLWFGVALVILIEIAFLTPPVGMSLFVISGIGNVSINEAIKSILPFLYIDFALLLIVTFFPDIITFLPKALMG